MKRPTSRAFISSSLGSSRDTSPNPPSATVTALTNHGSMPLKQQRDLTKTYGHRIGLIIHGPCLINVAPIRSSP